MLKYIVNFCSISRDIWIIRYMFYVHKCKNLYLLSNLLIILSISFLFIDLICLILKVVSWNIFTILILLPCVFNHHFASFIQVYDRSSLQFLLFFFTSHVLTSKSTLSNVNTASPALFLFTSVHLPNYFQSFFITLLCMHFLSITYSWDLIYLPSDNLSSLV